MDRRRDPAHEVRLLGLRFVRPDTERQYRRWRRSAAAPFARIGYVGSVPSWVLVLVAVAVLDQDAAGSAAVYVGGWILVLVALTALTVPTALRPSVVPLAAAANCAAGLLVVWVLSEVVLSTQPGAVRAGVMTAGLIVVLLFGFAIFRIPPLTALAAVTPYVAFGSWQLAQAHQRGDLDAVAALSLTAAQWIAYLGGLLVCAVTEVVTRRTFCTEQVIEAQQRELRSSREAVRRYVPRALFEHIVSGDTASVDVPRRRRVTVLFADLVGFTTLADRVEPEVLTQVANDFMTVLTRVVEEHEGTVSEFAGDGLMALFGAPDELAADEQAVRAVRAAQDMQVRWPALNREWERIGVPEPIRMRIGINSGVLSVGSFGSEGRSTYTAIGMHTNIAARLQSQCPPGSVLLSEATWHLVKQEVPCEPRGEVHCKGVHYPVRVFTPCAAQIARQLEPGSAVHLAQGRRLTGG